MTTTALKKAVAKYDKANTVKKTFKFNIKTDADILKKLAAVQNQSGYIKGLIRDDIRKENENESIISTS